MKLAAVLKAVFLVVGAEMIQGCTTDEMNQLGNALLQVSNAAIQSQPYRPARSYTPSRTARTASSGTNFGQTNKPYYQPYRPPAPNYTRMLDPVNPAPGSPRSVYPTSPTSNGSSSGSSSNGPCWNYRRVGNFGLANCSTIQ